MPTTSPLPVTVYSPESPLRHPGKLLRDIFFDLWRVRELVWILFLRDLKGAYRQSYFGYFWVIGPPIATSVVWLFLNSQKIVSVAETPIPYPAYVLIGTVLWQTFKSAFMSPLTAFNAGRQVFMKLNVPPEAFILKGMAGVVFNLLIQLLMLVPVFFLFRVVPPLAILLVPFALGALMLFGFSLGILLIPLGSLYTDVRSFVNLVIGFLMYTAPIVYPAPTEGLGATLVGLNPLTPLVMIARDVLTTGSFAYAPHALVVAAISLLLAILGMIVLRVTMPHLVVRMGM